MYINRSDTCIVAIRKTRSRVLQLKIDKIFEILLYLTKKYKSHSMKSESSFLIEKEDFSLLFYRINTTPRCRINNTKFKMELVFEYFLEDFVD